VDCSLTKCRYLQALSKKFTMYGSKNVRNNQPDLQAHWFIANYVVAAVDESDVLIEQWRPCGTLVSMLS
jgi:hypothetical protein